MQCCGCWHRNTLTVLRAVVMVVLWHMVEETEHKCVAHDVYQTLFGSGFGAYLRRAFGVLHGSVDVMRFSRRAYLLMLKKDGLRWSIKSRLRLYYHVCQFLINTLPFLFRATLPGHDPRSERDLQWVTEWLQGYDNNPEEVPIVDTKDPKMPVPFSAIQSGAI